ncbi:YrbA protein [Moritella sp. JT01]|uniref:BolA family protein n=1 Tax=Moritella sp. JT01 TaxID=756698 RepID=UPI00079159F0|nr:BolA family protein [Moritella sp. JT01]KXO11242.1 YrbA protein [Moritella sp. JT01]
MDINELQTLLESAYTFQELHVKGEGSHYEVIAVAEMFVGMNRVKKQQAIYAPLNEQIASNSIHALTIKAYTPEEWVRERKFILPS